MLSESLGADNGAPRCSSDGVGPGSITSRRASAHPSTTTAVAPCPVGQDAIGGGYWVTSGTLSVQGSYSSDYTGALPGTPIGNNPPSPTVPTAWTVVLSTPIGNNSAWAYVVCLS